MTTLRWTGRLLAMLAILVGRASLASEPFFYVEAPGVRSGEANNWNAAVTAAGALARLAADPDAFESVKAMTECRRAIFAAADCGDSFVFSAFDLKAGTPDASGVASISNVRIILELRVRGDAPAGFENSMQNAIKVAGPLKPFQRVAYAMAGDAQQKAILIALGEGALDAWRNDRALPAAVAIKTLKSKLDTRGLNDSTVFDCVINLDILRESWPDALAFGRTAKVLSTLRIPNLRTAVLRASIANSPGPAAKLVTLTLATSARSQPPELANYVDLTDSTVPNVPADWRNPPNSANKPLWVALVRPEWGTWIRTALTLYTDALPAADARAFAKSRLDWDTRSGAEGIRKFNSSLSNTVVVTPVMKDGKPLAGLFTIRSMLRAPSTDENLVTGLTGLVAPFAVPGSRITADAPARRWTFNGTGPPLLEAAAWSVGRNGQLGAFAAVVQLGEGNVEFAPILDAALERKAVP